MADSDGGSDRLGREAGSETHETARTIASRLHGQTDATRSLHVASLDAGRHSQSSQVFAQASSGASSGARHDASLSQPAASDSADATALAPSLAESLAPSTLLALQADAVSQAGVSGSAPSHAAAKTGSAASAAATNFFTAGDLVISVYGDGDGSGAYTDNQAAPVVLEELTASGSFVTRLVLPQTDSVNASGVTEHAFSGEYGSSSEGALELSADGQSLVIAGYAINAATYNAGGATVYGNAALAQSTSVPGGKYTAVARAIADVRADGSVDTSTALFNVSNTNNPRSVATVNGSSFYLSGQGVKGDKTQGVFQATDGASSATAIDTSTDTRTLEIYNGALYVSRDSKQGTNGTSNIASYGITPGGATAPVTLAGINGTDILTAAQANSANMSAIGTSVNLSPEGFFFASATTLYVADSGNPKEGGLGDGGLQKWIFNGASWNLEYTLSSGLQGLVADTAKAGTTGLIGLTGQVVGDSVQLYATNATIGDLDQTYLYGITDSLSSTTGAGESFATLATAAAGTNIRGVSFAPNAPCYAAGTAILTVDGERAVETLRAGDIAVTLQDGWQVPSRIVWVGDRRVDIARHPDPSLVRPIRLAPGAIADGVPSRPLYVSPDHALLLDGVLIAARQLVNGRSIVAVDLASVHYVHVELERHGVLLAEATPAESYLDTGNRHQFAGQAALSLHARFDRADHPAACARLATDAATVRPVWQRLADRAGAAPYDIPVSHDPGLHLVCADGRRLAPRSVQADGTHSFWLDASDAPVGRTVRLVSRHDSPAATAPWLDDRRQLGVAVGALALWTSEGGLDPVALPLDDRRLGEGWWAVEPCGAQRQRWTDGDAALDLPPRCIRLDVRIVATASYRALRAA